MKIAYQSEHFPQATKVPNHGDLAITWDDLLWAAMTVGRPNRYCVFKHGPSSLYEAVFRISMVRASLEQSGPKGHRLYRTPNSKTMDPSEKGAINYFLGLAICKLFADKLLGVPWLLHLDVFRPQLNAFLKGRSRPDLVGENPLTKQWLAFECKGRASEPGQDAKDKAKVQAERLVSVGGKNCELNIGAITFFKKDTLSFYWVDPKPREENGAKIETSQTSWQSYYEPFYRLFAESRSSFVNVPSILGHELSDTKLAIHPGVLKFLAEEKYEMARSFAIEAVRDLKEQGYQADGLKVSAGASWSERS